MFRVGSTTYDHDVSAPPADAPNQPSPSSAAPSPPGAPRPLPGPTAPAGRAPTVTDEPYRNPSRIPYLLSTVGLESMTAVAAPFFSRTLGAAPFALAGVEAAGRAGGAAARFGRNKLSDRRPGLHGPLNVVGNAGLALAAAFLAASSVLWQAGACRAGSWAARGLGTPPLLEEAGARAPRDQLGRRLGFERAVAAVGAAVGAFVAALLLEVASVRTVITLALVPVVIGLLVSLGLLLRARREGPPVVQLPPQAAFSRLRHGPLGVLLLGIALYELSNIAAVLLLLRASRVLPGGSGPFTELQLVAIFFGGFQLTAAACALWAGRVVDRVGTGYVLAIGGLSLLLAYTGFAYALPGQVALIVACFLLAGAAAGAVDTAEYAGVGLLTAPETRRAAFGALAGLQAAGRVIATLTAGGLWSLISPKAGLLTCVPLLAAAVVVFVFRVDRAGRRPQAV
ncbi:MAG: MFS transporter [Frankia sp.]|nr:MFS transporter [Frankia sp.]